MISKPQEGVAGDSVPLLLLAEDNPVDVLLVGRAMETHHVPATLMVLGDGEAAIKYIEQVESNPDMPCPRMLLLDLNLPKKSGADILQRARSSNRCKDVPVIVVTSSDSPHDREKAVRLGANRYFLKPIWYHEFLRLGEVINQLLTKAQA